MGRENRFLDSLKQRKGNQPEMARTEGGASDFVKKPMVETGVGEESMGEIWQFNVLLGRGERIFWSGHKEKRENDGRDFLQILCFANSINQE